MKMGEEIRDSNKTLEDLVSVFIAFTYNSLLIQKKGNTFDQLGTRLKNTFNRMLVMAKKSGISLKTWGMLFILVILFFLWVWIR